VKHYVADLVEITTVPSFAAPLVPGGWCAGVDSARGARSGSAKKLAAAIEFVVEAGPRVIRGGRMIRIPDDRHSIECAGCARAEDDA
jgi:hypothetical protein